MCLKQVINVIMPTTSNAFYVFDKQQRKEEKTTMKKLKKLNKRDIRKTNEYTLEAYTCCSSCPCIMTDGVNDNARYGYKDNNK